MKRHVTTRSVKLTSRMLHQLIAEERSRVLKSARAAAPGDLTEHSTDRDHAAIARNYVVNAQEAMDDAISMLQHNSAVRQVMWKAQQAISEVLFAIDEERA